MDLASMLDREDFFSFFFTTVEKYYREALNTNIEFSFSDSKKDCNMVIKPRLSAASAVCISEKAREFYYSEWNIRNSLLKNCAAKLYIFFATRTGRCFSQFRFTMTPEPGNIRDVIIAPNNRSIRIFDYGNNTVGCIIKEGFTEKFFKNQIAFRENYKYDFILPMIDYGNDWFREPIMHGHPLARITDEKVYRKALRDAVDDITVIAKDTLRYIGCDEYVSDLRNSILKLLIIAKEKKEIKSVRETNEILEFAVREAELFGREIPTVISHGDFQSGNIWVDVEHKVWIYDWETAGRRSAWYDVSVLLYSLRRNNGWKEFMDSDNLTRIQVGISCDACYSAEQYRGIRGIVLLEDICFYLEDMLELPDRWGAELYDSFIERIMLTDRVK